MQRGVESLDSIVERHMESTTVPGVAVGVVYQRRTVYARGFGLRRADQEATVDTSTVFQLASVSKPLSSTVVAAAVREKKLSWEEPIQKNLASFTLADPWVGSHVTVADMFSHRSGLPDHAGDLLEDLGYSQDEIIEKLRLEPLAPFRLGYAYTNYGLTAGGQVAAAATGASWPDLAQQEIFGPLGMTSTSFRFSDLQQRPNRAALHVEVEGRWQPDLTWDVDRQAPAGGASSSLNDMARWLTMLLEGGQYQGQTIIDGAGLQEIWKPQALRQAPATIGGRAGFYGLGWNLDYDSSGRLLTQHSGAFAHGGATHVVLLPEAQLGVVTLTNGFPVGLPEAIDNAFLDEVKYGRQTQDWLALFGQAFKATEAARKGIDYTKAPATATPPKPSSAYVGHYSSPYWGTLFVTETAGGPSFRVGPNNMTFQLTHYTDDQFFFQTQGESATGLSGAIFVSSGGQANAVRIEAWDTSGLGTFRRVG